MADSFNHILTARIAEEASDENTYTELADRADELYPNCGYGSILRDIAWEEAEHKQHLEEILADIKENIEDKDPEDGEEL